jgi:hypothetical protein
VVVDLVVVQDAVVDLVGEDHQLVAPREVEHALQQLPRVDGAGGVVGVDDHHCPGPVSDLRGEVVEVRQPVRGLVAEVVHRLAAGERGDGGPEREVGSGDEHFVAVVEERLDGHRDQLGDAVAEVDVIDADVRQPALLVVLGHRPAGGEDAARIGVAVRL